MRPSPMPQAATVEHDVAVAREAAQAAVQQTAPPVTDDQVRVTYIPESVKAQMREEIKEEVLSKARAEELGRTQCGSRLGAALSRSRRHSCPLRGRFLSGGNDNTGAFPIFNTINTGAPFDVSGTVFSPQNQRGPEPQSLPHPDAARRGDQPGTMALPSACGSAAARTTVRSPKTKPSVCRTTGKAETSASIRSGSTARS